MEVLKSEVWVSILGALILTAFLLWFLEKYSPFSARNNLEKYNEPVRVFDLKESFWFATTSFTPQGGGDLPKNISGRILSSTYWLFVVLILATFTANLAAFLTVERMKTSVKNLDELAQQSKINFSVVRNSTIHGYFLNLAKAEDDIYTAWKDISLKSKKNIYSRVWNYPVKQKFQQLLEAIEGAGTVSNEDEGFERVLKDEN
ncbi:ionotropic receptor 25a-like [Lepeophtheirus salmonis]|uniref:ionotropic receptor 25a-like n=1 Tax=Lepeophtheirus salmonis TaxID=72036 RepID=UPI001AE8414E|nr:ionotropic receptor 25a-like [Lepeophtheirus salmonis]